MQGARFRCKNTIFLGILQIEMVKKHIICLGEDVLANQRHLTIRVADGHRGRPSKAYDVYQNVLQMVVWESIFFNQGAACVEITQLWAILINDWLSNDCVFNGSSALQIRLNGVAVTL